MRTIEKDGQPYFVLKDVCNVLELSNNRVVAGRLELDEVSQTYIIDNLGRKQKTMIINESGLYAVILRSDKPQAKQFRKWVTSEVLPSIRKTGRYNSEPNDTRVALIETRQENVKVRKAQLMYKISQDVDMPITYKAVLQSHITELLTGERLLPLPQLEQKTYSAEQIADMLEISACMVGRLANKHNLKTAEYGQLCWDRAKNCDKQVQTFRYYISIVDKLRNIISEVA